MNIVSPTSREQEAARLHNSYLRPFDFTSPNGTPSKFNVSIYSAHDRPLVILSEHPENNGLSVTNGYELMATLVYNAFLGSQLPSGIEWMEHYPALSTDTGIPVRSETFDRVSLTWDDRHNRFDGANWDRLDPEQLLDAGSLSTHMR